MITYYTMDTPPMELTNVLLWDAIDREWRIGHGREIEGQLTWVDGHVEDANDCITDGEPVSVFTEVSYWARLPEPPC